MWAEACALLEQAERKHRHFFELLSLPAALPAWEPPADIFTDGAQFDVVLALPGARAEDIRVQISAHGLQTAACGGASSCRRAAIFYWNAAWIAAISTFV
jgi:HSP20 family molecular chaperone IbpA